jgi:hypothetical protein
MPSSYQVVLWKRESFLILDSCLLLHDDSSMNESGVEEELTGAEAVRQWFGSWPNFHDAEMQTLSACPWLAKADLFFVSTRCRLLYVKYSLHPGPHSSSSKGGFIVSGRFNAAYAKVPESD